jgi:cation/acetate symporter
MRFFTVGDVKAARQSILYASGLVGIGYALIVIIGFGTIALVASNPAYHDASGGILGGVNMVAIHLAHNVGGNVFLGFMCAVSFSTILAVVAGLTLAGSSAVSHDLYAHALRRGTASDRDEMRVSRVTTIVLGVLSILLAIAFEKQNIAFIVSNVLHRRQFQLPGPAVIDLLERPDNPWCRDGWIAGLVSAITLCILSPTVWVKILHHQQAWFPYEYPALFSMAVAFIGIVWFPRPIAPPVPSTNAINSKTSWSILNWYAGNMEGSAQSRLIHVVGPCIK